MDCRGSGRIALGSAADIVRMTSAPGDRNAVGYRRRDAAHVEPVDMRIESHRALLGFLNMRDILSVPLRLHPQPREVGARTVHSAAHDEALRSPTLTAKLSIRSLEAVVYEGCEARASSLLWNVPPVVLAITVVLHRCQNCSWKRQVLGRRTEGLYPVLAREHTKTSDAWSNAASSACSTEIRTACISTPPSSHPKYGASVSRSQHFQATFVATSHCRTLYNSTPTSCQVRT